MCLSSRKLPGGPTQEVSHDALYSKPTWLFIGLEVFFVDQDYEKNKEIVSLHRDYLILIYTEITGEIIL